LGQQGRKRVSRGHSTLARSGVGGGLSGVRGVGGERAQLSGVGGIHHVLGAAHQQLALVCREDDVVSGGQLLQQITTR
jgi:hypothetical protein